MQQNLKFSPNTNEKHEKQSKKLLLEINMQGEGIANCKYKFCCWVYVLAKQKPIFDHKHCTCVGQHQKFSEEES